MSVDSSLLCDSFDKDYYFYTMELTSFYLGNYDTVLLLSPVFSDENN